MQKGLSVNFLRVFCDLLSTQSQNSGKQALLYRQLQPLHNTPVLKQGQVWTISLSQEA